MAGGGVHQIKVTKSSQLCQVKLMVKISLSFEDFLKLLLSIRGLSVVLINLH